MLTVTLTYGPDPRLFFLEEEEIPNAGFEFELFTPAGGDAPVWYAQAEAEGFGVGLTPSDVSRSTSRLLDLISAASGAAVDKLLEDGVVLARSR